MLPGEWHVRLHRAAGHHTHRRQRDVAHGDLRREPRRGDDQHRDRVHVHRLHHGGARRFRSDRHLQQRDAERGHLRDHRHVHPHDSRLARPVRPRGRRQRRGDADGGRHTGDGAGSDLRDGHHRGLADDGDREPRVGRDPHLRGHRRVRRPRDADRQRVVLRRADAKRGRVLGHGLLHPHHRGHLQAVLPRGRRLRLHRADGPHSNRSGGHLGRDLLVLVAGEHLGEHRDDDHLLPRAGHGRPRGVRDQRQRLPWNARHRHQLWLRKLHSGQHRHLGPLLVHRRRRRHCEADQRHAPRKLGHELHHHHGHSPDLHHRGRRHRYLVDRPLVGGAGGLRPHRHGLQHHRA
mmetsp:Transcript_36357/g.104705  ORF Transcript_36357/g.104705 Transcript_36357/m.104705 type:complete len:348 (+) Transcript_36357:275-1318(+)